MAVARMTREVEDRLLTRCVMAARDRVPVALSPDEANVFRLAAQLVKTRYPAAASYLERTSKSYFANHREASPKRFPDLVKSGVVTDLPRFRTLLEHRLEGKRTW